jgi:hypothetical protein
MLHSRKSNNDMHQKKRERKKKDMLNSFYFLFFINFSKKKYLNQKNKRNIKEGFKKNINY